MIKAKNKTTGEVREFTADELNNSYDPNELSLEVGKEIEVRNPEGKIGKIPTENLGKALGQGYKIYTSTEREEDESKAWAKDNPTLAGAAGFARGGTLGLSDVALTKAGVDPKTLNTLKEQNPVASMAGEIGSLITPTGLLGGVGKVILKPATLAAKSALELGERVGQSVGSKIAAKQAAKGTSENVASKILQTSGKLGAQGATEGAIFGVGNLVSEAALENADFSAENLIKSIGYGAALGGGLGAGLGASGSVIKGTIDKGMNLSKDFAAKGYIKSLNVPQAEKEGLLKMYDDVKSIQEVLKNTGLSKQQIIQNIPDAELRKLAEDVLPSDNPFADKAFTYLTKKSTGEEGAILRSKVDDLYQKVNQQSEQILAGNKATLNETGKLLVDQIGGKFKSMKVLGDELYNEFRKTVENVPVSNKEFTNFAREFSENNLKKFSVMDQKIIKQELQGTLGGIRSFNDIYDKTSNFKRIAYGLRRDPSKFDLSNAYYDLADSLENKFADSVLKKLGLQGQSYAGLADKARDNLKVARGFYKQASDEIKKFQGIIGKRESKSIAGIDRWIDEFEALTKDPTDVANKLLKEDNVDLIKYMAKDHPEIFQSWKQLQRQKVFRDSFVSNGEELVFDANSAYKKMSRFRKDRPELFDLTFSKKEDKVLGNYSKVANKLKTNTNPSGTAATMDFNNLMRDIAIFAISPLMGTAAIAGKFGSEAMGDKIAKAMLKGEFAWIDDVAGARAKAVVNVVDNDIKQTRKINSASAKFIKALENGSNFTRIGVTRGLIDVIPYTKEELEKSEEVYRDLQNNPQKLIDSFLERNPELNSTLPDVSGAATQVITRAVEYLQSKIPPKRSDFFLEEYQPSRSEIFKFAEYSEAVFDPDKVLEKMKSGYVSPRQIEAMQVVYPETVENLRIAIMDRLPKAKIGEKGKNFISLVLGVQTKPSLEPQNIQSLQSSFAVVNQKEMGQAPQKSAKKIKLNDNIYKQVANETDKSLYRRSMS